MIFHQNFNKTPFFLL